MLTRMTDGLLPALPLVRGLDGWLDGWLDRGETTVAPALDVWEDAEGYTVEAEVPGVTLADLEIRFEGDTLVLEGKREAVAREGQTAHRRERRAGAFGRTLRFPDAVDGDRIEARLVQGVLTVRVPKAASAKPRKIAIRPE